MKKYNITWEEKVEYRMSVEADDQQNAKDKFFKGEYDFDNAKAEGGVCIDGSVEVFEI